MAKLSAYGRTQVASAVKESDLTPEDEYSAVWRKHERRLMSDGKVLEKITVKWRDGRRHDWGWKQSGALKATATAESWAKFHRKAGYAVTTA